MKTVIDAIVGILMLLGIGSVSLSMYNNFKKETLTKVHQGLPSLERYTQKLTGTKLSY
jgi:hypothetical protein